MITHRIRSVTLVLAAAAATALTIAACNTSSQPAASPSSLHSGPIFGEPSGAPTTSATPAAPAAPQYTASQQAAIQDAQSYLTNEPGFSEQGLIGQLEFDKFSAADAEFAVDHVKVDWDQQAAADAQNYQQNEGGFSCGSLISQLEFDHFTSAQATYGADQAGVCS